MVRSALIALLCSIAAPNVALALPGVEVRLPDCASEEVDVDLLRELLAIELSGGADVIEIDVDASLCGAETEAVDVRIALPVVGVERSDSFDVSEELDARARSRALALAIAERTRLLVSSAPLLVASSVSEPSPVVLGSVALAPPVALPSSRETADEVEAVDPRALPPTIGLAVRGRIAPMLPSWAIGLRADVTVSLDASAVLRGEILSTWSRGSAPEGDADAFVIGGALAAGVALYRDPALEVVVAGRVEGGALIARGTHAGGAAATSTTHMWGTAGVALDLNWWVAPGVALFTDLGVSAIVFGTQVLTVPSGTQIDLSIFTVDLDAGVRFAL